MNELFCGTKELFCCLNELFCGWKGVFCWKGLLSCWQQPGRQVLLWGRLMVFPIWLCLLWWLGFSYWLLQPCGEMLLMLPVFSPIELLLVCQGAFIWLFWYSLEGSWVLRWATGSLRACLRRSSWLSAKMASRVGLSMLQLTQGCRQKRTSCSGRTSFLRRYLRMGQMANTSQVMSISFVTSTPLKKSRQKAQRSSRLPTCLHWRYHSTLWNQGSSARSREMSPLVLAMLALLFSTFRIISMKIFMLSASITRSPMACSTAQYCPGSLPMKRNFWSSRVISRSCCSMDSVRITRVFRATIFTSCPSQILYFCAFLEPNASFILSKNPDINIMPNHGRTPPAVSNDRISCVFAAGAAVIACVSVIAGRCCKLIYISYQRMAPKPKKRTKVSLERMLLEQIPETPVPEPYFNIPSPEPYTFPLSSTLLEGIKLLENYYPDDINDNIRLKMKGRSVERMARHQDKYCMMGQRGNGLLVGEQLLDLKGISAFAYGPGYLLVAFEDLRLEVYSLQLRLLKAIRDFSSKRVTYLKLLAVPRGYESIILLSNQGSKLFAHRIEKSFFSVLSVKLNHELASELNYPVTNICEIPPMFRSYLQRDPQYRNSSLFAVAAVNAVFIFALNYSKLDSEAFCRRVFFRRAESAGCSWVSWGEASVLAPSRDLKGDKLVLSYSFDNRLHLVALNEQEKSDEQNQRASRCEWVESSPFEMSRRIAFVQQMKKNELLLVTEDNTVVVFHTRSFDVFEKELREEQVEMEAEANSEPLEVRAVAGREGQRCVSYAETFLYEYPSSEIYFMTQRGFGVYVYCNWRLITDLLRVEQKYECAMIFLTALHKRANRFDLGVAGQEKELREYGQMLSVEYVAKKLGKIREVPEILNNLLNEEDYLRMIVVPLEFLTETDQFEFLFNVVKEKIVGTLAAEQSAGALRYSESIFFKVLEKFIEHGRVKFIPENQLEAVLQYYVRNDQLDMVDRLAIYFDLARIDRNIVIQCLLQNNLVVSLAHICTQGNESEFVTPFVKFWGASHSHQLNGEPDFAVACAFRALWYVKLCLQRNWILKEYTLDQYAKMITILSQHFLSEKILLGLLELRPTDCLNTLSYYFTIENSQIVNASSLRLGEQLEEWIQPREGNRKVEQLLSTISCYLRKALRGEIEQRLSLYLSSIIIYKTVRFTPAKYYDILVDLIRHYPLCSEVGFGLDEKMLAEKLEELAGHSEEERTEILAARYINKILTLVYYQFPAFIEGKLASLYEESRLFSLPDLQAEISFLQRNYSNCIEIYLRAKGSAKGLVFEFLENEFKRLVLERKRSEKNQLASCIQAAIKQLLKLDPRRTITLVQNCVPEIQEELIAALDDDQELQLEYLEKVMREGELAQMKARLSEQGFLTFVRLMAARKEKSDQLVDIFRDNSNRFNISRCIEICEEFEVIEGLEYLYERMGSIRDSMRMAALRIDRILSDRNLCDEEDFAPYIKIKEILDHAIAACRKNNAEENWESLLDSSIALYNKYRRLDFPEDEIEIFFYINGEIIENMAANCALEHTVDLLQNKYADLNMGGKMTKAFINIISNQAHLLNIIYLAANLVQHTLQRTQLQDFQNQLTATQPALACLTCSHPLSRRARSLLFRCGHAYHLDCLLPTETRFCVACFLDRTDIFRYCINSLNPLYPKVKKAAELAARLEEKKFEVAEAFRVEEFEQNERREDGASLLMVEKKREKLERFDRAAGEIERGNWRVLAELGY